MKRDKQHIMHFSGLRQKFLPKMLASFLIVLLLTSLAPSAVWAQAAQECTSDPSYDINYPAPGHGPVSSIVSMIQGTLSSMSECMFNGGGPSCPPGSTGIVGSATFIGAVNGAISIYIVMYGILFMVGIVQITLHDFVMRMIKIGIITVLLSGGSWGFFSTYVVTFFQCGMNDIIGFLTNMTISGVTNVVSFTNVAGACANGPGAHPFDGLDQVLMKVLSVKMFVTITAIGGTLPYGPFFLLLIGAAMMYFIKSLLTAMWVYLMAIVLQALLFGLAPIFIVAILFERTKHLFQGWINQLVNTMLQPIMLFAFFSFFVTLISSTVSLIIPPDGGPTNGTGATPVCWSKVTNTMNGTAGGEGAWRFETSQSNAWVPYAGDWSWDGPLNTTGPQPVFPIDLMNILIFLLLAELAGKFNSVVLMIASDLAGATTNFDTMSSALDGAKSWFKSNVGGAGAPPSQRGGRGAGQRTPVAPGAHSTDTRGKIGDMAGKRTGAPSGSPSTGGH